MVTIDNINPLTNVLFLYPLRTFSGYTEIGHWANMG